MKPCSQPPRLDNCMRSKTGRNSTRVGNKKTATTDRSHFCMKQHICVAQCSVVTIQHCPVAFFLKNDENLAELLARKSGNLFLTECKINKNNKAKRTSIQDV